VEDRLPEKTDLIDSVFLCGQRNLPPRATFIIGGIHMKRQALLFFALTSPVFPLFAGGTFYVASTGSNSNPCTATLPCLTLAAVVSHLTSNDTILALDSVDMTQGTGATLPGSITVDGGSHGAFMSLRPGNSIQMNPTPGQQVIFRNITMELPMSPSNIFGFSMVLNQASVFFKNVTVISQDPVSDFAILIIANGGSVLDFDNVSLIGGNIPIQTFGAAGAPYQVRVRNMSSTGSVSGVSFSDGSGLVQDSSFSSTLNAGLSLGMETSTSPTWMVNNCQFSNNGGGLATFTGTSVRLSNSVFSGNTVGLFTQGTVITYRNNFFAGNGTDNAPLLSTSTK
jgi:hypothetical protein